MSLVCLSSANCLRAFLCIIFRRGFWDDSHADQFDAVCGVWSEHWQADPHPFNLCSNAGSTHMTISQTQSLDMTLSTCTQLLWLTMARPVLSGTCPVKPLYGLGHRAAAQFQGLGNLDINGCVLSYFEGTAHLYCYTSCTLTTLHCSKVSFLQCCHMKKHNKISKQMWGVYSLLWDSVNI